MAKLLFCLLFLLSYGLNLQASESASTVMLQHGFNQNDLVTFENKYPELKTLKLATGVSYDVPEDHDESYFQLKLYTADSNEAYIVSRYGNDIDIEKANTEFKIEIKKFEGIIQNTLFESVMNETDSPVAAETITEAFQDEFINTKGLRVQAFYKFQIEQYFDNSKFIKFGNVLSASLIIGKAITKKVYKINPDTLVGILMPYNSLELKEKIFYLPLDSKRITSVFQLNRRHPITRKHQPHNGIDFGAPRGLPVYPALDGIVTAASRTKSKGKFITILHDNGYQTTYCHLKKFSSGIKTGRKIELGEKIGEVGKTGFATGAHLHFAILEDGFYVNPINLLKGYSYNQRNEKTEVDVGIEDTNIVEGDVSEEIIED